MRCSSSLLLVFVVALTGCYSSHVRSVDAGPTPDAASCDPSARPRCMQRPAPCDPLELVDAECVGTIWQCPAGAQLYASPWTEDHCLPLRSTPLFPDGVHESPVPVPIGDVCDWIFPLSTPTGPRLIGVATASSCDALVPPAAPIDDTAAMGAYHDVQSAFATRTGTRVLGRTWVFDSSEAFGVRALGVQLGRVSGGQLIFGDAFAFAGGIDLGDAALVDGGFVYAYGHPPGVSGLEAPMAVGRAPVDAIDEPSAWSVLGTDGWGAGDPAHVFGSGPHRSAVVADPRGGGFLHVYAAGFGSELRLHTASRPEGPWADSVLLAPCELPADDPGAYCAGPQVHRELLDPMDPSMLVVSYSIGSTSIDQDARRMRDPDAYWPHVVRLRLP